MRTLDRLKKPVLLRPPKVQKATPCAVEVATLFNCWRALAVDAPACAETAAALMTCMATQKKTETSSASTLEMNNWLAKARRNKQL